MSAAFTAAVLFLSPAWERGASASAGPRAGGELRIYYRSPILVRPGERVRIPVDVACVTARGRTCGARVSLVTADRTGRWRSFTARAKPNLEFDLTGPAKRAAEAEGRTGFVAFRLAARTGDGRFVSMPGRGRSLRMYVAGGMRRIAIPSTSSVPERRGAVALSLPWGTGRYRAGLSPGNEAATVGPPSFDVDAGGRIYLLDAMQHRVAVFSHGRLLRQIAVSIGPQSDISVASDAAIYLASQQGGRVTTQVLAPSGRSIGRRDLGPAILGEIRVSGSRAFVHVLPADAWVPLDRIGGRPRTGLPLSSGRMLLDSVVGRSVRIGLARGTQVARSFELDSDRPLGELALGARDARRGLVAVVRILGTKAERAGRYVAVRVDPSGRVESFSMPAERFTDQPAYSQIRLGADGALYQLRTFPDGMRILRYELGEGS